MSSVLEAVWFEVILVCRIYENLPFFLYMERIAVNIPEII